MKRKNTMQFGASLRFSHQQGASLLEGLAFLGIAAMVILGAVSLLSTAFGNAKANQTTEQLMALRTSIKKLYSGQSFGTTDMVPTLYNAKAIPSTLSAGGSPATITGSWGGSIAITGANGGAEYTITIPSVPQDVCISVISGASGWTKIAAGTNTVTTFPATASDASTLCSTANTTLVFTGT